MTTARISTANSHTTVASKITTSVSLEMASPLSQQTQLNSDCLRNKQRQLGRVKFFNFKKGYGFIIPEATLDNELGIEVFVHHSSIASCNSRFKSLAEGETVEFVLEKGSKGYKAGDVTGPGGAPVIGSSKACPESQYCCGYFDSFGTFVPYYTDLTAMSQQWPINTDDAGCYLGQCAKYSAVELKN